jgi:hypothetical protein
MRLFNFKIIRIHQERKVSEYLQISCDEITVKSKDKVASLRLLSPSKYNMEQNCTRFVTEGDTGLYVTRSLSLETWK